AIAPCTASAAQSHTITFDCFSCDPIKLNQNNQNPESATALPTPHSDSTPASTRKNKDQSTSRHNRPGRPACPPGAPPDTLTPRCPSRPGRCSCPGQAGAPAWDKLHPVGRARPAPRPPAWRNTAVMSFATSLRCRECGRAYPLEPLHVCEFCFGPL